MFAGRKVKVTPGTGCLNVLKNTKGLLFTVQFLFVKNIVLVLLYILMFCYSFIILNLIAYNLFVMILFSLFSLYVSNAPVFTMFDRRIEKQSDKQSDCWTVRWQDRQVKNDTLFVK